MLTKFITTIRSCFIGFAATMLMLFFPVATFADAAPIVCAPPTYSDSGVHTPTGSDAGTFKYVCAPGNSSGVWENDYYTYNPETNSRSPRSDVPVNYKYDCAASTWYMTRWDYIASSKTFEQHWVQASTVPDQATNCPPPPTPTATSSANSESSQSTSGSVAPTAANNLGTAGTSSSNGTNTSGQTTASGANSTSMSAGNVIGSFATSGDASVFANTSGGSATSGNAQVLSNVANLLQSSGNALGAGTATFVANIDGDVNGDLLLDPALIGTIQPASNTASSPANGKLTVNNASNTDQSITNDINLAAKSGNADVTANTTAGNATTGSATAIANVLNVLNSAVSSGQSFLGVININGNLNGDILLPPNFIDQLLASNVPTVKINTGVNLANNTNQTINNAITTSAASGKANVAKNTTAGNATTGTATTNVTAFNLTGSSVMGSNDLLVFVNVLGTWYGMIFNAPGATSAELGGGITQNSTNNARTTQTNTTNQSINNNINVAAQSGDASVTKNTTAGNATSGNAHAAVNILNVADSNLSLANWFGVLFINVFGSWNGSFGVNTAAGDPVSTPPNTIPGASGPRTTTADTSSHSSSSYQPRLFRFVASSVGSSDPNTFSPINGNGSTSSTSTPSIPSKGVVLAAHTEKVGVSNNKLPTTTPVHRNFWLPAIGVTVGVGMLVFERVRSLRRL